MISGLRALVAMIRDLWARVTANVVGRALLVIGVLPGITAIPGDGLNWLSYRILRLHLWWPVLVAGTLIYLIVAGQRRYARHGLPQFHCLSTIALVACLLMVTTFLLSATAADWTAQWSLMVAALVLWIAAGLVLVILRHAEPWRTVPWCNRGVIDAVGRELDAPDRPRSRTEAGGWGSRHRLCVVDAHYQHAKEQLIFVDGGAVSRWGCLRAGEELVAVLQMRWPGDLARTERVTLRLGEVQRELATIALLGDSDEQQAFETAIGTWTAAAAPGDAPVDRLLRQAFRLGRYPASPLEPVEIRREVVTADSLLRELAAAGTDPVVQAVCEHTWLALAHHSLAARACFDVWAGRADWNRADPLALAEPSHQCDPATVAARQVLVDYYRDRAGVVREGWREGLARRLEYVSAAAERDHDGSRNYLRQRWARREPDARSASSWPYREVAAAVPVRRMAFALALAVELVALTVLTLVNPVIDDPWDWNSIEHITGRGPLSPLRGTNLTALAGSGNVLGIGTERAGLVIVDKGSRAMRADRDIGAVLDVVPGAEPGTFIVLGADQRVSEVSAGGMRGPDRRTWLPAPENPVWRTQPFELGQIVGSSLDNRGWLLVVKSRGLARYQFNTDRRGDLRRLRSWQQSSTSSGVALDLAQITERGVWFTLEQGGIRFAGDDDLAVVDARTVKTPPIRRLDADAHGRWATAIDDQGGLWFYDEDGGWSGPWFGASGDTSGLGSVDQLRSVRLDGGVAWMSTGAGVYAYDVGQRRMHAALQADAGLIEPVKGSGRSTVIVASASGLYRIDAVPEGKGIEVLPVRLDEGVVRTLAVNPDGSLAAYSIRPPNQGDDAIRAIAQPFTEGTSIVVTSGPGLRDSSGLPDLVGAATVGDQTLFAGSTGCFLYNATRATYEDCTFTGGPAVTRFTAFGRGDHRLVALANGSPLVLDPAAQAPQWTVLDGPMGGRAITETAGRILVLDDTGEIEGYGSSRSTYGAGRTAAVTNSEATSYTGDLRVQDGRWQVAFLVGDQVVTYDSQSGQLSERALPAGATPMGAALRYSDGGSVVIESNGTILTLDGDWVLGRGGLAFDPSQISALAGAPDGTVLVGGPAGRVFRYNWRTGSWSDLGSIGEPGDTEVVELGQEGDVVSARVAGDDAPYEHRSGSWNRAAEVPVAKKERVAAVTSGPWLWHLASGRPDIVDRSDGRERVWVSGVAGNRFRDDVADELERGPDGQVRAVTADGRWTIDGQGRTNTGRQEVARTDRIIGGNAALGVTADAGTVTFDTPDGQAVFSQGRFYFDDVDAIGAADGLLYTAVPGRAIIARDPQQPGLIVRRLPLPDGVVAGTTLSFDRDGTTPWLRVAPTNRTPTRTFALNANGGWRQVEPERVAASAGLFEFRTDSPADPRPRPFLAGQPVDPWWDVDRFAWDRVNALAVGDGSVVLEFTSTGVMGRRFADGAYPQTELWAQPSARLLGTGRDGPRALGAVVSEDGGGSPLLIRTTASGSPAIQRSPVDASVVREPRLTVALAATVTIDEAWVPSGSGGGLVRSALAGFEGADLLRAGRFVFDNVATAAPSAGAGGSRPWLGLADCDDRPAGCLTGIYVVADGRMVLRSLSPARQRLSGLGSTKAGALVALGPDEAVYRASIAGDRAEWDAAPIEEREAFRRGDAVEVDSASLVVGGHPRFVMDPGPVLTVAPGGARLFVAQADGVALAFDVFTSLALDPKTRTLTLGSRAGTQDCPDMTSVTPATVSLGPSGEYRMGCGGPRPGNQPFEVERLRLDPEGHLWARTRSDGLLRRGPGNTWTRKAEGWPPAAAVVADRHVAIIDSGIEVDGLTFTRSNDVWWRGRRELTGIIDVAVDDRSGILWMLGSDSGLFKVAVGNLPT